MQTKAWIYRYEFGPRIIRSISDKEKAVSNKWAERYGGHWEHNQRQYDRTIGWNDYTEARMPPWSAKEIDEMSLDEFDEKVTEWMFGKDSGVPLNKKKQDWTWMNWLFILFTIGFFLSLSS